MIMRYFLSTNNINKINLYLASIEIHFYHFAFHIDKEYFNISKSVLYIKKLVIDEVITLNKSIIIWKKSLMTTIPSLKYNQIISKTFNTRSQNIRVLIIIKI